MSTSVRTEQQVEERVLQVQSISYQRGIKVCFL